MVEYTIPDKHNPNHSATFKWNPNAKNVDSDNVRMATSFGENEGRLFTFSRTAIIALANALKVKGEK